MPQVNIVDSLRDISVDWVIRNMKLCCPSNYFEKDEDAENQITTSYGSGENVDYKINNLFQQLPAVLLKEIIMLLTRGDRTVIENQVLDQIITPQLQYLRLNPFLENDLKFFSKLLKLQVLHATGLDLKDSCLKVIGTHCKYLRILNIGNCFNITDAGIGFLCIENQGSGQCKSLQILQIQYCYNLTKNGIKMALENLPALRYLEHEFTFEVMVELAQMKLDSKMARIPTFQLSILRAPYSCASKFIYGERIPYRNRSLSLFFSLCPSVVKLELNLDKGFMDAELLCLISLKMLRELIINRRKEDEIDITFDGGVAPVLKVIGRSLENLNLSCFDVINFWIVVDFCPNLISLTICRYFLMSNSFSLRSHKNRIRAVCNTRDHFKQNTLRELENLKLDCKVSSNILLHLLSSPTLVKIDIRNCDTLTDAIFLVAFNLHQFQNLNMLKFRSCSLVTYQVIDMLMVDGNPVSYIKTEDCQNFTEDDVNNWKTKFHNKNWYIEWSFHKTVYSTQE